MDAGPGFVVVVSVPYSGSMTTPLEALPKIGAPALRALHEAGYTSLRDLAGVPRIELAMLHGMGPKALTIIDHALHEHGEALK